MPSPNFAPLRHPAWWSALALLALNDHVLKGAGVLPGALTGKLSDFAGLIVAPVLVAALVGARTRRARVLVFAAVAAPFAAINLSPTLASMWDAAVGWSTTTDPTDLIALVVAPLAIALAGTERTSSEAMPRAAIALGSLACIATSPVEPIMTTAGGPILEHQSDETVSVRVRWVDASIDCDWLLQWMELGGGGDELARALDPSLFDEARTFSLEPGQSADLTRPFDGTATERACDALILSADGLEPRLVAYPASTTRWESPGTLTLETRRDGFRLAETGMLLVATPEPSAEPASCERASSVGVFSWAGEVPSEAVVRGFDVFSDGCFAIELEEIGESRELPDDVDPSDPGAPRLPPLALETYELTLCVPGEYAGFEVGEHVELHSETDFLEVTGEHEGLVLERLRRRDPTEARALCQGSRMVCGGYAEPLAWDMGTWRLNPGVPVVEEILTLSGEGRRETRLLDDATRVVAAHADCGLEPGLRGVLLTHWEDR